jgi:hypothetical protein
MNNFVLKCRNKKGEPSPFGKQILFLKSFHYVPRTNIVSESPRLTNLYLDKVLFDGHLNPSIGAPSFTGEIDGRGGLSTI